MIDIIIDLKIPELNQKDSKSVIDGVVQKTKWGEINLN